MPVKTIGDGDIISGGAEFVKRSLRHSVRFELKKGESTAIFFSYDFLFPND